MGVKPPVGKGQSFQHTALRKLDVHLQKNEVGSLPYAVYKINSKWVTCQNVRAKTTELFEENTGENLHNIGFGDDFLPIVSEAQQQEKNEINAWESKGTIQRVKSQPQNKRKSVQITYLIRD